MGSPRIKDRVLEYLTRHPGVTVWRGDIAKDLGFTDVQVTSAVYSIMAAPVGEAKHHLTIVEQGRAWRWSEIPLVVPTNAGNGKRLFEELTSLPDGRTLVKGDDGKVYWLSEV